MNDKTPNPGQNPEPIDGTSHDQPTVPLTPTSSDDQPTVPFTPTEHASASDSAASDPTTPAAASPSQDAEATPARGGRTRALVIGGGIAAALVLLGGGVAIGAAIDDDHDDRPGMSDDAGPGAGLDDEGDDASDADRGPRSEDGADDAPAGPGADAGPGAPGDPEDGPLGDRGPAGGAGTASADELVDIAQAARDAADGEVTSLDAKRDGAWEVQLTAANGDETEVRVDPDGTARVLSTDTADGDDTGPSRSLDEATIRSLVAAALDEADGLITDIDVDDDGTSPYDVSVLTTDNRSIDIDFGADFAVVGSESD